MSKAPNNMGAPLPEPERTQLRKIVDERGEARALVVLELNRQTLARALGGLGLRRGSHALIRDRLRALGQADAPQGLAAISYVNQSEARR